MNPRHLLCQRLSDVDGKGRIGELLRIVIERCREMTSQEEGERDVMEAEKRKVGCRVVAVAAIFAAFQ